jgi:hypothetical protein
LVFDENEKSITWNKKDTLSLFEIMPMYKLQMKRITILFFAVVTTFSVYSQDGDSCFDNGDYACAVTIYSEAFRLASGKDKQLAEIKLTRAKNCVEWTKSDNQSFTNGNYSAAKENYQKVLDSNPKDAYAKTQLEKCNNLLNPPTTLSVSKENLSFSSSGGGESITVNTNASSYSLNALPSWCTIQKYTGYFIVTCNVNLASTTRTGSFTVTAGDKSVRINVSQLGVQPKPETTLSVAKGNLSFSSSGGNESITVTTNAGSYSLNVLPSWCTVQKYTGHFVIACSANSASTTRTGSFTVTAGDKSVRINVSQSGVPPKSETTLSVSKDNLSFSSSGGKSEKITVYSNAGTYSILFVPAWCSYQTYNDGSIVVICNANNRAQSRSDWLKVTAGGKEVTINIAQSGTTNTTTQKSNASAVNEKSSNQSIIPQCFNCPKGNPRPLGLSLGAVQKQWEWKTYERTAKYGAWDKYGSYLEGIQAGVRVEPLFKYGFGLNTGLFYEYYFSKSDLQTGAYTDAPGIYYYVMNYTEHSLCLPLHLEYRANFAKKFQFFSKPV